MHTTNLKPKKPDLLLSIPVMILIALGMIMVYSSSGSVSKDLFNNENRIIFKQAVALVVGIPLMIGAMMTPHQLYRRKGVLILGIIAVIILLIGVLSQMEAKGASRWYYIFGFGFQPSVLATLLTIVFVATFSTAFSGTPTMWIQRMKYIIPFLVVFCGLILAQNDFGSTMIILVIAGLMLFLAGLPMRFLWLGGILLLPIMVGLILTADYRVARIKSFLYEEHYQVRQSKYAIGSGGLTGVGLAQGKQKLHYLPEPHTDFIFATLGEEFGFLGCMGLLLCYLVFLGRGVYVLSRVEEAYSRILGSGILMLISLQAMLNISIALGLFPNKGLTLPFISAGGTSLIMSMIMFGILLNISRFQVIHNRAAAA